MQRDLAADVNIRPMIADNLSDLIRSTCVFSKQPALSLLAVSHNNIFNSIHYIHFIVCPMHCIGKDYRIVFVIFRDVHCPMSDVRQVGVVTINH